MICNPATGSVDQGETPGECTAMRSGGGHIVGTFKKTPQALIDLVAARVEGKAVTMRRMFGGVGCFVNGTMFAGAHQDAVFLRLPQDQQEALKKRYDEVTSFEPMAGRPMREYVTLPESVYGDGNEFDELLEKSRHYAASLPPRRRPSERRKV
jgi:TfoX/Sxy family transcriptional regulator of competence genes